MEKTIKNNGKYTREAFEDLCKNTGLQHRMNLDTTEFHSKVRIHAKCIITTCVKDMKERSFENLITNGNMGCIEHSAKITAEKTAKSKSSNVEKDQKKIRTEYSIKTLVLFIDENKLELKNTIESLGNINFNTPITARCQVGNCTNYFTKAYGTLNKNKNFSCNDCLKIWQMQKRTAEIPEPSIKSDGKPNHYDSNSFIKFCDTNNFIPVGEHDLKMTSSSNVNVKCLICNTQMKQKTFQSLVRNPKCKTCIKNLIDEHTSTKK